MSKQNTEHKCTFKYGKYIGLHREDECGLATEINRNGNNRPLKCQPEECPFDIIRRIFEKSTGVYMGRDMTGI